MVTKRKIYKFEAHEFYMVFVKSSSKFEEDKITVGADEADKIFSRLGIDIHSLGLTNLSTHGYHNFFENLTLKPYFENGEVKVQVSGEYITYPADWYSRLPKRRGIFNFSGMECPETRIKIDLTGKL